MPRVSLSGVVNLTLSCWARLLSVQEDETAKHPGRHQVYRVTFFNLWLIRRTCGGLYIHIIYAALGCMRVLSHTASILLSNPRTEKSCMAGRAGRYYRHHSHCLGMVTVTGKHRNTSCCQQCRMAGGTNNAGYWICVNYGSEICKYCFYQLVMCYISALFGSSLNKRVMLQWFICEKRVMKITSVKAQSTLLNISQWRIESTLELFKTCFSPWKCPGYRQGKLSCMFCV